MTLREIKSITLLLYLLCDFVVYEGLGPARKTRCTGNDLVRYEGDKTVDKITNNIIRDLTR